MKRRNLIPAVFIVMATLLSSVGYLGATPTVIRDARLKDLGITPALGRGYSMATNTYQSICLKDMKTTKPTYDFTYTMHELTYDSFTKSKHDFSAGGSGGGSVAGVRVDLADEFKTTTIDKVT
ncbi:MAG: hypothetical protein AAGC55_27070, partial [Myxococcota bacterium]